METKHDSVLMKEAIEGLSIAENDIVVDATLGGAGHFREILSRLGKDGLLIGIDADEDAVCRARTTAASDARADKPRVEIVNDNFRNLNSILDAAGAQTFDKALFDLGWSSFQLTRGRGFSFREDEPLLMTYGNPEEGTTAADFVNSQTEEAIAEAIYTFGEERFARGIAKAIVSMRKREKILTTHQLVDAVISGTPKWYQHRRLHPATKTFQALRIAVNDELGALREALTAALDRGSEGSRIAVISFHSIEDRIVKSMFREAAYAGRGMLVNRKPIAPSPAELAANPRARSAKLRIFECGTAEPVRTDYFSSSLTYV